MAGRKGERPADELAACRAAADVERHRRRCRRESGMAGEDAKMTLDMLLDRAIDRWLGELARSRRSPRTRDTYRRCLYAFADTLHRDCSVDEITADDCRQFLDRWVDASPSTMASNVSILTGFFRWLIDEGQVPEPGPMSRIRRPRRKRPEDLDVVTISDEDAHRLLAACLNWQELLCIATALMTGRRRAALNAARRSDVDLARRTIRFRDKGDKVHVQRIPAELVAIIEQADADGVWSGPGDYLIPSRRPSIVSRPVRKDSVIWDTVKLVAGRAGVNAHVHSLRAAFAVRFDAQHPDRIDTLRTLMGHDRLETTLVYLRRKDRVRDQEVVDDLTWGLGLGLPELGPETPDQEPPGWNRVTAKPRQSLTRPIRDSNPCHNDSPTPSRNDDEAKPNRPSLIDVKLAELRNAHNARRRERP